MADPYKPQFRVKPRHLRQTRWVFQNFPRAQKSIQANALNKAARIGRNRVAQEVKVNLNATITSIRKKITIKRAVPSNLEARIQLSGSPIPLVRFGGRKSTKSVSYQIERDGVRKKLATPFFINKLPSGAKHIFKRLEGVKMKSNPKREAIIELYGPSVPEYYSESQAAEQVDRELPFIMKKQLADETQNFLRRRKLA